MLPDARSFCWGRGAAERTLELSSLCAWNIASLELKFGGNVKVAFSCVRVPPVPLSMNFSDEEIMVASPRQPLVEYA